MTIHVSAQKPAVLDPHYTDDLTKDYDPEAVLKTMVTDQITQPLRANVPVSITENNQAMTDDELDELVGILLQIKSATSDYQRLRSLLRQSLVHYDPAPTIPIHEVFVSQIAVAHKMPAPAANVRYTAGTDIIPAAKTALAGRGTEQLTASITYTYHPQTLGVWFPDADGFKDFQTWADLQVQAINAQTPLDPAVLKLMQQFGSLSLKGLTESLRLRKNSTDAFQPGSFPRLLIDLVMRYCQNPPATATGSTNSPAGLMPFSTLELVVPSSIVFVNVEAHARASSARVHKVWDEINKSLALPVKMVSNQKLSKLTAVHRMLQKAQASGGNGGAQAARSARVVFRKKPPTSIDLIKGLTKILRRMGRVSASQNIYKRQTRSFARASRRDPSGLNSPGISTRIAYLPDLHVYLDTSGSISEINYQDAIMMLIRLAKKMDVNLYFNSFSHVLSQPVLLKTKGKSVAAIYREFTKVPKVTGGTDFEQIWRYIEASPKRKKELSLMITDFEWGPHSSFAGHPKNLYYAPVSNTDWTYITRAAKNYVDSMAHIEPNLARRLVGLYV